MAVSSAQFKAVMGSFASGVTVVTTADEAGTLRGITVSAFSSLSLEPPLCLVCIGRRSSSLGAIEATRRFAVNLLAADQEDVSSRFASRSDDRFAGIDHRPGPATGCPVLPDSLAWMECEVRDLLAGGDHQIVVGELVGARVRDGKPLLYWGGAYGDLTSRPKSW